MRYFYLLTLSVLFLTHSSDAQPGKYPDKKLMQEINDAWSTLDPGNAAKYYDTSGQNIYYDVSPFRYMGWQEYSKGAKEFYKTVSEMKYTVGDDAAITADKSMAYGTSSLRMQIITSDGEKQVMNLRWTVIWEYKNGSWLIVHEHLSLPAE